MKKYLLCFYLLLPAVIYSQSNREQFYDSVIDAWNAKAKVEQNSGQFQEAITDYDNVIHYSKIVWFDSYGIPHSADSALAILPALMQFLEAYQSESYCYEELGDDQKFISLLKTALGIAYKYNFCSLITEYCEDLGNAYNVLSAETKEHTITSTNKLGNAIKYWNKCIIEQLKCKDIRNSEIADVYQKIADAYNSVNNTEKYEFYSQKADKYYGIK